MRAARFASVLVVFLAGIPACSDNVSTPLAVSWLEWSDSVTAGIPFGVRVYGEMGMGEGGGPASVRITVRVNGDTLTIQPYTLDACRGTCPLISFGYDTLVWVPAITTTVPRRVTVRAPSSWQSVAEPWPLRTFGTLTVSPDTVVQPLMRSVGVGSGFQDGLGCSFITHAPSKRLVSADQSPPWTPGFSGFIYGRVDPVAGSPCILDAPVILVDSIAVP